MPEITRSQLVLYAVALCAIAWLGARYIRGSAAPAAAPVAAQPRGVEVRSSSGGPVTVHVAGAVRNPGVYRLRAGARALEAVERAGGATRRADLAGLNLAGRLEDGRQVVVPVRRRAGTGVAGVADAPGAPAQPIDLNSATLEQLDTLDGVGPATAQKILDYREANGGFGSVAELGQVSGIGEKRMATLREKVRV